MANLVFGFHFNLIFQSYYYLRGHFGSHISHLEKTYWFLVLEVPRIVSGKVWKSRAGRLMAGGSRNKCACALLAPLSHLDSIGVSSHWAGAAHVQVCLPCSVNLELLFQICLSVLSPLSLLGDSPCSNVDHED